MEVQNEVLEAVEPDIEVTVTAGDQTIAVVGVFQNKSDVWDIIVGVDDRERRVQLEALFTTIASAMAIASFTEVHPARGAQLSFLEDEPAKSHYDHDRWPQGRKE